MKPGFIIMNQNPKTILRMATHILSCQEKVQVSTLCRKTYADSVLGYEWINSRTLSGERRENEQCSLEEKLKPAIHSPCWLLFKGVLHDSA
jgi:hypothetical protein